MRKLFNIVGATVGGYAGWSLGAHIGLITAFTLSTIGSAAGIYFAWRAGQRLLG